MSTVNRFFFVAAFPFICWCAVGLAAQEISTGPMPSPPSLPWNDDGTCPFEGCSYREWTASKATVLHDTWKAERKTIGRIVAGERVTVITGTVITHRPGVVRMDRDLPAHDLMAGDTILTYAYRGEGHSAVWFKGNYHAEFDISFAKWPDESGCGGSHCAATYLDLGEKVWWAQIKLQSGLVGWVNMSESDFTGTSVWE